MRTLFFGSVVKDVQRTCLSGGTDTQPSRGTFRPAAHCARLTKNETLRNKKKEEYILYKLHSYDGSNRCLHHPLPTSTHDVFLATTAPDDPGHVTAARSAAAIVSTDAERPPKPTHLPPPAKENFVVKSAVDVVVVGLAAAGLALAV